MTIFFFFFILTLIIDLIFNYILDSKSNNSIINKLLLNYMQFKNYNLFIKVIILLFVFNVLALFGILDAIVGFLDLNSGFNLHFNLILEAGNDTGPSGNKDIVTNV